MNDAEKQALDAYCKAQESRCRRIQGFTHQRCIHAKGHEGDHVFEPQPRVFDGVRLSDGMNDTPKIRQFFDTIDDAAWAGTLVGRAVLAERERCARIAESKMWGAEFPDFLGGYDTACEEVAEAIRKG